ncbi:MAG: hypothetical protein IIT40_02595, partial [Prevotella sp.]|nr:hypothetical protein [Prevotella sp.]
MLFVTGFDVDISPDDVSSENIRSYLNENGQAYLILNADVDVPVLETIESEEPFCFITKSGSVFFADAVEDKLVHVWFMAGETLMSGYIHVSFFETEVLDEESACAVAESVKAECGEVTASVFVTEI